jgi:hypothetical protein
MKLATSLASLFILPFASLLISEEEFPDISAIPVRSSEGIAK